MNVSQATLDRRSRIRVRQFHHHAFRTRDMEATRHFWEDILGCPLVGTFVETTDPVTTGNRLALSGAGSTCGTVKAFPGTVAETGLRYDTFAYTNTGPARCVTFQITGNCPAPGVLLSAYSGAFNPADVSAGYLGDAGLGSDNNVVRTLALDMTTGQSVNLVVSNATLDGGGAAQTCAWRVTYDVPSSDVAAVPSLGEWGLALTGLLAAGLGARRLRRRGA